MTMATSVRLSDTGAALAYKFTYTPPNNGNRCDPPLPPFNYSPFLMTPTLRFTTGLRVSDAGAASAGKGGAGCCILGAYG